MAEKEYIERGALIAEIDRNEPSNWTDTEAEIQSILDYRLYKGIAISQPAADVVEIDKVAEMLQLSFGDDYACNFNGNDEWLPFVCKYAETDCPYPKERLGCWKEFVKHFLAKMDGERKEQK